MAPEGTASLEGILLQILLILIFARLFAELANRVTLPPVLGELTAGIVLGVSGLGWITTNPTIYFLAEIGIILLLFDIALSSDFAELVEVGKHSVLLAFGGIFFPFALAFGTAFYVFDLTLVSALFIGGTLTATSIAITVRVLSQYNLQATFESKIVLGAALLDDVIAVIILGSIYHFVTNGGIEFIAILRMFGFIAIFFLITPWLVNMISSFIERIEKNDSLPGLIPVSMVSLVLAFAYLAEIMGVPAIIGGFAAGLSLSRHANKIIKLPAHIHKKFRSRVHKELRPLVLIFTPIFFVSVGLSLDLRAIDFSSGFVIWFSLAMAFVAVIGKIIAGLVLSLPLKSRLLLGMAMVPRGEVSLVFAQIGATAGVLSQEVYAGLLAMIVYVIVFSPFWIKIFFKRWQNKL